MHSVLLDRDNSHQFGIFLKNEPLNIFQVLYVSKNRWGNKVSELQEICKEPSLLIT